uniref:Uncharacterized protein n=1 Tax=Arundo donax TaxID=35708 RepID=A0A0A9ADQ1_ARUDO
MEPIHLVVGWNLIAIEAKGLRKAFCGEIVTL